MATIFARGGGRGGGGGGRGGVPRAATPKTPPLRTETYLPIHTGIWGERRTLAVSGTWTTVEPLNNGLVGTGHFVLYREVVWRCTIYIV